MRDALANQCGMIDRDGDFLAANVAGRCQREDSAMDLLLSWLLRFMVEGSQSLSLPQAERLELARLLEGVLEWPVDD